MDDVTHACAGSGNHVSVDLMDGGGQRWQQGLLGLRGPNDYIEIIPWALVERNI
jgi:hypothetical protein